MFNLGRRWFSNPQEAGSTPSALLLVLGTTATFAAVMFASFTPLYAAATFTCGSFGSQWCYGSGSSNCPFRCVADNYGDPCSNIPNTTISWAYVTAPTLWPRCTGTSGNVNTTCTESATMCGNSQSFYYGQASSGLGCALPQCLSNRVWGSCSATGTPCSN